MIIIAPSLPVASIRHVPVQFVETELPDPQRSAAASQEDQGRCAKEQPVMVM